MYLLADTVTIDWKETIFAIVGGLGIFLFGINMMGDSLKAIAGSRLKIIIEKTSECINSMFEPTCDQNVKFIISVSINFTQKTQIVPS